MFRATGRRRRRGWALAALLAAAAAGIAAAVTVQARADDGSPATGPRYPVVVHRGASLPAPAGSKPVPLLLALHASGGSPSQFEQKTGLDAVADEHGFVVAYLSSHTPTGPAWRGANLSDDLAYIKAEIRQLVAAQNIDPKRVYVTGFSAGATMTFKVGCQLSAQVAGIAVVSGAMRTFDPCSITHPVSELLVIGTRERIPIDGSAVILPAATVAAKWRGMNGCTSQSASSTTGPVVQTLWSDCNDHSAVVLDIVTNGNHQWPGPTALGADASFDASKALWQFFTAHPGPDALSAPTAGVTNVRVRTNGAARWIEATVAAHETGVKLRLSARPPGRAMRTQSFSVARGVPRAVALRLPAAAPKGRYALTLVLTDGYGRRLTLTRSVVVAS